MSGNYSTTDDSLGTGFRDTAREHRMSEKTGGQAAYEATVTQAVIDGHGIGKYPAYDQLEPWQRRRWEAAAAAVIEAAPPRVITCDHSPAELGVTVDGTSRSERVAELVTEGNELRRELAEVRKLAADLERDRNVLLAEQMRRLAIGAQDAP